MDKPTVAPSHQAQAYAPTTVALVTAALGLLALLVACYSPMFPKDIRPLMPVLRSNVWLAIHVISILAGYGAALLACGLRDTSPWLVPLRPLSPGPRAGGLRLLGPVIYKVLQIALLLLSAGAPSSAPSGPTYPGGGSGAGTPRKFGHSFPCWPTS